MAEQDKIVELSSKCYKDQAVWFLNAFWDRFEGEAERLWNYVHKLQDLDLDNGAEGNEVDEFKAHQFLEHFDETMTVRQMREKLKSVGVDRVKMVPLTHFLVVRFDIDWHELVNAPQGNKEEIDKAQAMLDEVNALFEAASARAEEAKAAEAEARAAEARARDAEAAAKAAEAAALEAKAELEAAQAELQAQEDAYNGKTEELKRKSEEGGIVSRNRAKNELAQHLGEDPLPLRRAKITNEAAVKKATKTAEAAAEARAAAEAALREAEAAVAEATRARQAADDAVDEAAAKVAEAEAFLDKVKRECDKGGAGAMWWIDRELHEKKKYMPMKAGGIART